MSRRLRTIAALAVKFTAGMKKRLRRAGDDGTLMTMNKALAIVAAVAAVASQAFAATAVRVDVPPTEHADTEASAEVALPPLDVQARTVALSLELDASPSNNVEMALGEVLGADWPNPSGTAVILGWERGEWVIKSGCGRQRFSVPSDAEGRQRLEIRVRLSPSGAPVGVVFPEEGLGDVPLDWLDPRRWARMRVTSRGQAGATAVSASVAFWADPTVILVH